jgi:hypothetical protein
MKYSEKRGQA